MHKCGSSVITSYGNVLLLTYDALGVNMTGTIEVCDSCSREKEKSRYVRKKMYTRATNSGEMIFVVMTSSFPEMFIAER